MNTYRTTVRVQGGRIRRYRARACHPGPAINRALNNLTTSKTSDVDVSCRLIEADVAYHYSEPKVRAE